MLSCNMLRVTNRQQVDFQQQVDSFFWANNEFCFYKTYESVLISDATNDYQIYDQRNRFLLQSYFIIKSYVVGGKRWKELVGSYPNKKGKLQQARDPNKVNWGVPSTHRSYNRQTRYWCDFDQKEKKVMRKEQMIKKPTNLVK